MITDKEWIDEWALALDLLPKRLYLYVICFKDSSVYVGMSGNIKRRMLQHKNGKNFDISNRINTIPYSVHVHSTIDVKKDLIKEEILINEYKSKGINVLNKISGGSGGFNKTSYLENTFTKLQRAT